MKLREARFEIALLCAIQSLQFIPLYGAAIALGLLCVVALRGADRAIKSLLASFLITFANSGIYGQQQYTTELKWLLLLVSTGVAVKRKKGHYACPGGIVGALVVFCLSAAFVSFEFGVLPTLSLFKIVSFVLGLFCVVRLASLSERTNKEWVDFVLLLLAWLCTMSLPLLWMPAGRLRNGVGFQGILSHPQAFGALVAGLPTIAFIRYLTSKGDSTLRWGGVTVGAAALIYLSQARTGMLGCAISIGICFSIVVIRGGRLATHAVSKGAIIFISGLSMLIVSGGGQSPLVEMGRSILQKHTTRDLDFSVNTLEAVLSSRADQIEGQLQTFRENPLTGIGFGIQNVSQGEAQDVATVMGIPLSSPTEPGFLPIAVLAQVGLMVGGTFFIAMIMMMVRVIPSDRVDVIGLFTAVVMVNLGEAIAFSFGGLGLYMWMCVAICIRQQRVARGIRGGDWKASCATLSERRAARVFALR